MTLSQFIKENREGLECAIKKVTNFVPSTASCNCPLSGTNHMHDEGEQLSYAELRLWILNDEGLYKWARSEGVRI